MTPAWASADHRVDGGVEDPARVASVRATGLLAGGPEEAFNRLTRLAAVVLETPMVFMTVADDVRAVLKGVPHPEQVCAPDGTFEAPVRETACQVVIDTADELVVTDVALEPRLRDLPQLQALAVAAWIGVPVVDAAGRVVGNFCAMDTAARPWSEREVEVMRTLAGAAAGEVALRLALDESERHAAQAAELADTLQQSLMPAHAPRLPGVQIATRFRAGGTGLDVLGDFWDVVPMPDGFGVVVGDVCGHGAPAARTTAMARSAVRTAAHSEADPAGVLRTVHDVLRGWFGRRHSFASAVYATFSRDADGCWALRVAGAGHPPGFVRRRDGTVTELTGGGRVLGITAEPSVEVQDLLLGPGDSVVLYTDGITEARCPGDRRQLDEAGVAEALRNVGGVDGHGPDAEDLAGAVADAAERHAGRPTPEDDAAVVVISVVEASSG